MSRSILHCDMNNFYASVECMLDPSLKKYPVAVCGSVEERHGIVLAKNYAAKAFDVKTGDAVWQAKQKCKDLVIVPPHYEQYIKYSKLARSVYTMMDFKEFTTRAEQDIRAALEDASPGVGVGMNQVEKLQGESYTAITLTPEGTNIGMNLNLNQLYDRMQRGEDYDSILQATVDQAKEHLSNMPRFDVADLSSYRAVRKETEEWQIAKSLVAAILQEETRQEEEQRRQQNQEKSH